MYGLHQVLSNPASTRNVFEIFIADIYLGIGNLLTIVGGKLLIVAIILWTITTLLNLMVDLYIKSSRK